MATKADTNASEKKAVVTKAAPITPATVSGLSVVPFHINITGQSSQYTGPASPASSTPLPANVGPAKLSGNIVGQYPANTLLPSDVVITQGFHTGHTALDLAGPQGTKIYAPEALTITQAGKGAFGIDVIGQNALGDVFTFGHFEAVAPGLVPGQRVPAGTLIGYEGSTFTPPGYSTGPHLHLQENTPGGGAVIPTAQDILNTFVTGLTVPTPSASDVLAGNGGSSVPAVAPNTTLLTTNAQTTAAILTNNQTGAAVNAPDTGGDLASAAVTPSEVVTSPAASAVNPRTDTATTASSTSSLTGFLAGHAPLDYAALAVGLGLILFGALLIFGQTVKGATSNLNPQKWQMDFLKKQGGSAGLAEKVAAGPAAII